MDELTEKSYLQNPGNFNPSSSIEKISNKSPKNINQNQSDLFKDNSKNSPVKNSPNANAKQSSYSNLYYTSNIKKACHKSITLDSKIIKNLNEQNFINNTCIKNRKRNSKNISSGIRKMLKILKLDDENCNEENDGENSYESSGNFNTKKIKNTNGNKIEDKNINENIKEEKEFNLENKNNSNFNQIDNKKEEKYENKVIDLNKSNENNINSKNSNEINDSNKTTNNSILNISTVNSIEILKNRIEPKNDLKIAYIVSNENSINLTQNKMNKELKLVIEKNNFELNKSNKKNNVSESTKNKTEYKICNQFITSFGNIKNNIQINNSQNKEKDNNNNLTNKVDKEKIFEINNINNFSFIHEKINDNNKLKNISYQINKIDNINIQYLPLSDEQDNKVGQKVCLNNNLLKDENLDNQENNKNKISNVIEYQTKNTNDKIINENKKDKSCRKKKQNFINLNKNENFDKLILENKENICSNKNNNFSICNRNQFEYDIDNDDNKNIAQNNHVMKFIKMKKDRIFNDFLKSESNIKYKFLIKEKIKIQKISNKKHKILNRSAELISIPSMNINHIKYNDKSGKNIKDSFNGKKCIKYKNASETKNRSSSKYDIYQRNIKLKTYSAYGNTDVLKQNNHIIKKKFLHYLSSKNNNLNFNTQKGKAQNLYRNMSSLNNKNIINISNISNTNNNCDISIDMHPNYIKSYDIKSTSDESNTNNINKNYINITNNNCKNKISYVKKKIKRSSSIKEYINNYNMNKINLILNKNKTNCNTSNDKQKNSKRLMNKKRSVQNIKNEIKMKLINNSNDVSNTMINDYNGPIDIKYISLKNYEMTIKDLIKRIKILKYKYIIIDFNLYKCIRGTKILYIEVVKIKNNLYYYLITRDKKNLKHKKNI